MTHASNPETEAGLPASKPSQPPRRRAVIAVSIALVVALAGALYLLSPKSKERTDAAYLQADETVVAPQVKGRIVEVLVRDNARVKAGDALIRIDAEDLDARVLLAQAEVQSAEAAVRAAKAALVSLDAEELVADSNTRAVETGVVSAGAQRQRAALDRDRFESLVRDGAAPARELDIARAAAVSAQADADRSTVTLAVSRQQAALTRTKREVHAAALAQAESGLVRNRANLKLMLQEQNHALVRAPVDGVVGALQVHVGDYVQPATRLMSLVPMERLYVVAYFKETQLAQMKPGQTAHVEIDAYPGIELAAQVESLAPGTGSQFALLPFEPGSGNFTKVVQRVPVYLRFNAGQEASLGKLRPGLSSTVEVHFKP